jgi:starch phosphorylase
MEIGVDPDIPTYAGGLGILAGDTIRAAADLQVPMVAVTLLHRQGYFYQRLDESGWQTEAPVHWVVEDFLTDTGARADVTIEGRIVKIRAWKYEAKSDGFAVPVYFLDTDLPENAAADRALTGQLYGGDEHYRFCQEVVLGIGGVRMLRALGHRQLERFHMNEGHSSLLTLELMREEAARAGRSAVAPADADAVRMRCVFTTHTPVPAGHDQFPLPLVERMIGTHESWCFHDAICHEGRLNMTYLALAMSHYVNGVAKKHGEVAQHMYAAYKVDSITNGVHPANWASPFLAELFDRHVPGWRTDNFSFRYALSIPDAEIWEAHVRAKQELIEYANRETNAGLDRDVLTIGLARRATAYKRLDLLFDDLDRLRRISREQGKLQIIAAGKAHPRDRDGKLLIQRLVQLSRTLGAELPVAYLPNYDMELARLITSGVDLWLNTPQRPLEASGTSGMKAALNGVPSLSVLDGWWIEGCLEGTTGWAIGTDGRITPDAADRDRDAASLYEKLESAVVPIFYHNRGRFIEIMRHAIALNGSFFNTQRMLQQYVVKAYFG